LRHDERKDRPVQDDLGAGIGPVSGHDAFRWGLW
jgi:hypothetical protein